MQKIKPAESFEYSRSARSQPASECFADVYFFLGLRFVQVLGVCVYCNKINPLYVGVHHVIDGIAARTTNANDANACK